MMEKCLFNLSDFTFHEDKALIETELIKFILNLNINSCPTKGRSFHQEIGKDYGRNIAQLERSPKMVN